MTLKCEFESRGNWLFRHRSYLPFCATPIFAAALLSFRYLDQSHWKTELWAMACLLVSLSGLAVRVLIVGHVPKGTSGRNTRTQVANTLNRTGLYSLLRHPLYVGNYLAMLGFVLFFRDWRIVGLATCLFVLYYERIIFAEEAFLRQRFGEEFERWAANVPAIFPGLRGWVPAAHPFSWRNVLRREYTGMFLVLGGFAILDIAADSITERQLRIDPHWALLLMVAALVYLALRTLKKQTRLLHVDGR
jgi:protein-S-isoprenylcysteine O-methyltransferase Ste14